MKPIATKPRIGFLWNSRLARRLVQVFVLLVAVPLVVTVFTLGRVGHEQIRWTARTMEQIHAASMREASRELGRVGREALHRYATRSADISANALVTLGRDLEKSQADGISKTARDLEQLTNESFDQATRQSLGINRVTLLQVRDDMTRLQERSAGQAALQAADNIEEAMLEQIETRLQERASLLSRRIRDDIDGALMYLKLTAQMPSLRRPYDAEGQKVVLDALLRKLPIFTRIAVLNANGRETSVSDSIRAVTPGELQARRKAAFFVVARSGRDFVGLGRIAGGGLAGSAPAVLRMAVPIEANQGKVVGVLTAQLSLDDLWDTVRGIRVGPSGFAYVLDGDGAPLVPPKIRGEPLLARSAEVGAPLRWRVVVAQPRGEATLPIRALKNDIRRGTRQTLSQMRHDIEQTAQSAGVQLQRDAFRVRDANARRVQARTRQLLQRLRQTTAQQARTRRVRMQRALTGQARQADQNSDRQMTAAAQTASLRLANRVDPLTDQALARANRRLSLFALVIVGVSCGVGCLIALFVAGRIVRPVVLLAQNTRAIAQGDLQRRVDERGSDEIGDLAAAFNTMAASLHQSRVELHEAEAQLVHSAKLASLGTLSAGVAHELNQPVALIRGLAQQLVGEPGLSADAQSDLRVIESQTGRMMKIINHLRTFSRAQSRGLVPLAVNPLIRDCFILVGAQLKAGNIHVELDLGDEDALVLGDANELEQVFLNLITNARDALEGRDQARLRIRSRRENGRLRIDFCDNGPGISPEVARRIFDPFFTTKEPGKGTGLGLSISHGIVQKHQGMIRVENDNGAVFTITLPLAANTTHEENPQPLFEAA